ncbi:hypothetical protein [Hymenobacter glacieicola]|uniref:Uncharacterized protein n=1 Tax=Hymenobacter glacieicola TaxID=1562124 RepID=A0ABQ1WZ16_9BACT|nr:hypothetical protein [Hymenobacter glacieicola]GGG51664.1 hypothetical protein GCM10011378_29830 [Hymenobacter glacieicola]
MSLSSENLTRLIDGLCLSEAHGVLIKKYLSAADSEVRELIAGARNLHIAWERRGGNWGNTLSGEQIDGFGNYLQKAHENLSHRFSTAVLEAESFARLTRVYMGFSDIEAVQSSFQNASYLVNDHLLAHLNYFKAISPKWLGDVELLGRFVLNVEDKSLKNLLKLMYVVELYSDKYYSTYDEAKVNYEKAKFDYVSKILSDIHPLEDDSLIGIYTNNYIACLYRILGMQLKEIKMSKYLVARRTNYPWAYFG